MFLKVILKVKNIYNLKNNNQTFNTVLKSKKSGLSNRP